MQPQISAHNSSAKLQKVSEIDEESTKIIFETAKKLFGTTLFSYASGPLQSHKKRENRLNSPLFFVELEAPDISLKKMQFLNKIGVSD